MTSPVGRLRVCSIVASFVMAIAAVSCQGEVADKLSSPAPVGRKLPSVNEMIESRTDVWGDAAMQQPNGASYEFFKDVLPPLRWVNADFRHYPIVLSAPRASQKVRLVSNGSAVNAHSNKPPMWFDEGAPVKFFVGNSAEAFGQDLTKLDGPSYLDRYLPIVTLRYKAESAEYCQEVFAPVDKASATNGAAMIRFSLGKDGVGNCRVEARFDSPEGMQVENGQVIDENGHSLAAFGPNWRWDRERQVLIADLVNNKTAELAVFTSPAPEPVAISSGIYDKQRAQCIQEWKNLLGRSINLVTPEAIVNEAWRATLIGNFMIVVGDRPHYSAQNAYGHLYEGECGDTVRSLMLFGHLDVGPAMLKPLLEFPRKDTRFHVAGQKLQMLSHFYWLTRDADTVRRYDPLWRQALDLILSNREPASGLLPKDNYAGDIHAQVYSLNSNANCWRGLRDLAAVLDDMGSKDEAKRIRERAADYRKAILRAVDRSEHRDTNPPYLPIALLADEQAPDPLTSTELGSYYDLICPYIIHSEIFGQGSERENWLLGYLQNHGGITMGMMRTERHQGENKGSIGMVPLYALRYNLALLRRDERERALVAFYGHLAQAMTRETFIGGEGSRFSFHGDDDGREFVLPPNSTSNATWLIMLRYLLIQDWDLNEDGRPDTLRLMFGVPRRWLADGQQIRLDNAPTAFGRVSLQAQSKLGAGYVEVHVAPPSRPARKMLLRAPLPEGWQVDSAQVDGRAVHLIDNDTIDLSGKSQPVTVRFKVEGSAKKN